MNEENLFDIVAPRYNEDLSTTFCQFVISGCHYSTDLDCLTRSSAETVLGTANVRPISAFQNTWGLLEKFNIKKGKKSWQDYRRQDLLGLF